MSTKTESGPTILDKMLLALAAAILVGGVVAYYMFPEQSVLVRTAGVLAGIGIGLLVAAQTHQGKTLWRFIQSSRVELRKVIWPNRQETVQTTIAVIIFAIVMAVFFWVLDLVLLAITQAVRGRGLIVALRWYVVHAYSNFEHKVKKSLEERIKLHGLDAKFGEIMVPTEEVVEMKEGQKRRSERKFFPGYVLVQMDMDEDTWHLVKEVPKVLGFIGGSSDRPAPISDKEADAILQRVQEGVDKPRPKVLFEPGEVVRVVDGPFNDFNGVVEQVNYDKSKLRVAVQILGRSTPVELDFSQVEKA